MSFFGAKDQDFGDQAIAQSEANAGVVRDQTYANRPDQMTPWGYTSWDSNLYTDPGSGLDTTKWSQTMGLSPELMDLYNKQLAITGGRTDIAGMLTGRMGEEFGSQMDWSGLAPIGGVPGAQFTLPEGDVGNPNAFRQRAEDAMYNKAQSRLAPQYDSKRQAMEIKLRNQGLNPEDEVYKSQMQSLGQQETDAYDQAMWGATSAGRDESDAMFGQALSRNQNNFNQAYGANQANFGQAMEGSKYANQIRQQQLTEQMQKRGFSLNEINALLSGGQVNTPQMPNFATAGAAQPAPVYDAGITSASAANAANPINALLGAAGTAGGAFLGNPAVFTK